MAFNNQRVHTVDRRAGNSQMRGSDAASLRRFEARLQIGVPAPPLSSWHVDKHELAKRCRPVDEL